jgi:hypothetical protein
MQQSSTIFNFTSDYCVHVLQMLLRYGLLKYHFVSRLKALVALFCWSASLYCTGPDLSFSAVALLSSAPFNLHHLWLL